MKIFLSIVVVIGGSFFSGLALAHLVHQPSISFMAGAMHPLSGLDHLLVIVLVGFWSAFALRKSWFGPAIFMLGMTIGVGFGFVGYHFALFEIGIALSVVLIGALLLSKNTLTTNTILVFIGVFGLFHGFAHTDLLSMPAPISFQLITQDLVGLLLATALLHSLGVVCAKLLKQKVQMVAKGVGMASLIYGLVLVGQLAFIPNVGASL